MTNNTEKGNLSDFSNYPKRNNLPREHEWFYRVRKNNIYQRSFSSGTF